MTNSGNGDFAAPKSLWEKLIYRDIVPRLKHGCQPHSGWDIFYPRTLYVFLDLLRYPGYILSRFKFQDYCILSRVKVLGKTRSTIEITFGAKINDYTLPQKKGILRKGVSLLGKSVHPLYLF